MPTRRTDQRRRRVLMEEAQFGASVEGDSDVSASSDRAPKSKSRGKRAYSVQASRRYHLKTSDLIPKGWGSWLVVVASLVLAIGLLNLAATCLVPTSSLAQASPDSMEIVGGNSPLAGSDAATEIESGRQLTAMTDAFSLTSRTGFAAWYSSFLLILSSLASLQIFALRQHRSNDYRGTYRIWLWFAAILLVCSLNCIVDISGLIGQLLQQWTGTWKWITHGAGFSLIKLALLALIVVRGMIEVRLSPSSLGIVGLVWLAYTAALVLQIPAAANFLVHESRIDLAEGNLAIVGASLTLVMSLCYARAVLCHASGALSASQEVALPKAVKKTRSKAKRSSKSTVARRSETSAPPTRADADTDAQQTRVPPAAPLQRKDTGTSAQPSTLARMLAKRNSDAEESPRVSQANSNVGSNKPLHSSGDVHEATSVHQQARMSKSERRRLKKEKRRAA